MEMKEYKTGIFAGKFFPLHRGHLNCIDKISSLCDTVYLVFYNNSISETKRMEEGSLNYPIDRRIEDAKKLFEGTNVKLIDYKVNTELYFPIDFEEVKKDLLNLIGEKEIDLQIFGKEEEEVYKNYVYAKKYITCEHCDAEFDGEKVPLRATVIRKNLNKLKNYIPDLVYKSIQELNNMNN